ncbi:hypothetical protein ALC57_18504 [Trachymyrmex cornetzi]|uniref:GIY-YIG domain-containing protein n=1 Tax=Trachymyrmex cornetzi TaxID=471704 RepID=A0A151IRS1_9HYME|nr:hypothetical protein ALC57_18504 [Trachymyrmex cornetzi]
MEELTSALKFEKSRIICLPFISAPPSNFNTIYTALLLAHENACKLNISRICSISFETSEQHKVDIHNDGSNSRVRRDNDDMEKVKEWLKTHPPFNDSDKLISLSSGIIADSKPTLIHNWYHKPTFSGRYLNFFSRHPLCQKVVGLIDRVLLLSHPSYHQENFELIIKILLNNGYPLKLIFSEIKNRLSKKFKQWNDLKITTTDNTIVNNVDTNNHSYFTIPFIPFLSEKIKKFFKKDTLIRMAYKGINNLKGFIKSHKDFRSKLSHTDVVYKIECQDCDASYVGQTGRCLKTRINEHRNHINWNTTQRSVITEHRISHQHEFDWENIKILDKERVLNKRLISEMIHIKQQRQNLNLQNDMYTLNPLYSELLAES